MGVLAHRQVREELHLLADGWELVERGERNERFVADALDIHRYLRGERVNEFAVKKSDHGCGLKCACAA